MTQHRSLYRQVVHTSGIYLGPAAERFINRHITYHLQKQPEELDAADLGELINWVKLSMGFLTDDQKTISIYVHDLREIEKAYKDSGRLTVRLARKSSSHATSI
jgi:hypothetical protein